MMIKASKGTVVVENFKDRLRLRWRVTGRRYCLSLGLPDTKESRKLAEMKARQIELDVISGNFDTTLSKYKPQSLVESKPTSMNLITCGELFQQFMDYKAKFLHPRSLDRYKTTLKYLQQFYCRDGTHRRLIADQPAIDLGSAYSEQFNVWLKSRNAERARKEFLILLSACWAWGKAKGIIETNPWQDLQKQVRQAPKQPPKPFTQEEVRAILAAFKIHPQYKHYADFVEFMFLTGVRTAEAIGLRWQHINDDFSSIWIGESLSRGIRKSTKTNKARYIPLNDKIKALLKARRPENYYPDDLVFPSPDGLPIDDRNFRNRAWVKMLEIAGVEYRKPYNTRHTFVSMCLEAGMNPVVVASITGHDVQTLYRNYAGCVVSRPSVPELF
jgi:integrase